MKNVAVTGLPKCSTPVGRAAVELIGEIDNCGELVAMNEADGHRIPHLAVVTVLNAGDIDDRAGLKAALAGNRLQTTARALDLIDQRAALKAAGDGFWTRFGIVGIYIRLIV